MNEALSIRNMERALDELARGYSVRLTDGTQTLPVQAAQCVAADAAPGRLVLSPRRAQYLGIQEAVAEVEALALEELLYAPALSRPVESASASGLERRAVQLVKLAGFLPAAYLGAEADAALGVSVAEMEAYAARPVSLVLENTVSLPIAKSEHTRVAVFREQGGRTHLAVVVGTPQALPAPLVRLHSSCLTGDLLGSLRCDCGGQLHAALHAIAQAGHGVLLYLNQEGRGIGLANKMRAYRLQEQGLDTVDANLALGFEEDERDFAVAARMLHLLGLARIRLLTNNPEKISALSAGGITVVERVAVAVEPGEHNRQYLETKALRLGHQY